MEDFDDFDSIDEDEETDDDEDAVEDEGPLSKLLRGDGELTSSDALFCSSPLAKCKLFQFLR